LKRTAFSAGQAVTAARYLRDQPTDGMCGARTEHAPSWSWWVRCRLGRSIGMLADSSFLIRPQFGDGPIQTNPCTVTMKRAPLLLMLQSDHWI